MKKIILLIVLLVLSGSIKSFAQDTLKLLIGTQTCSLQLNNGSLPDIIRIKGRTTVLSLQNRSGLPSNGFIITIGSDGAERSNLATNLIPASGNNLQMTIFANGMLEDRIMLGTAVTITVKYIMNGVLACRQLIDDIQGAV